MSAPKYPELFPIAIGNEEESMLMTGSDMRSLGDPVEFVSAFGDYMPAGIKKTEDARKFMQNGGLMYDGGAVDPEDEELYKSGVNLERATPECATPAEAATYIQANEQLYVKMLQNYVERRAKAGEPEIARAQRRVIDPYGTGRACHDSLEARQPGWLADFEQQTKARNIMLTFLQTRSFMTGAGYVTENGTYFAQKVQHLTALNEYGYVNSAYRNASENDTGARFEVRCNDINISPWAIQARLGGTALLFTMLQTPVAESLTNYLPASLTDAQHIANFKRYNHVVFDPEGYIKLSVDIVRALDFQERVLEQADEELGYYVELPEYYQTLLHEMRYYCQDFRKVLHGELPLVALADRSDMAAKFARIFELQHKARGYGIERKLGDVASRATDLRYDNITVSLDGSGHAKVDYGYAYKQRDKGQFRLSPKQSTVEHAMYYPPTTTRAHIRGTLIHRGEVNDCSWSTVKHEGLGSYIRLNDVILNPDEEQITSKI